MTDTLHPAAGAEGGAVAGPIPRHWFGGCWQRGIAWMIDLGLLYLFLRLVEGSVYRFFLERTVLDAQGRALGLFNARFAMGRTLAVWLFPPVYAAFLESTELRATLGKRFMGLRVLDVRRHDLSLGRALLRTLLKVFSIFPLPVGFLLIAFTARRQGLHDLLSRSAVVKHRYLRT